MARDSVNLAFTNRHLGATNVKMGEGEREREKEKRGKERSILTLLPFLSSSSLFILPIYPYLSSLDELATANLAKKKRERRAKRTAKIRQDEKKKAGKKRKKKRNGGNKEQGKREAWWIPSFSRIPLIYILSWRGKEERRLERRKAGEKRSRA